MAIETIEDITEEIANKCDIYGAHNEACDLDIKTCRCCFVSGLMTRLIAALLIEQKLGRIDKS